MNTGRFKGGFVSCRAVGEVLPSGRTHKVSPICFRKDNAENYYHKLQTKNPSKEYTLCHTTGWEVSK